MQVTISVGPQLYADGVTLGAYPVGNWLPSQPRTGTPKGSPAATATLTGGQVTFDLTPGTYYVTKTTSPYLYLTVIVTPPENNGDLPAYPGSDGNYYLEAAVTGGSGSSTWGDVSSLSGGGAVVPHPFYSHSFKAESFDPIAFQTAGNTLTSGQLLVGPVLTPFKAGETISSITCYKSGTNLANQTNQWFCLIGLDLKVIRATVNDTTAAWNATTAKTLNLSTPWTPTVDTWAYVGVCVTVSTGTTGLNLWSSNPAYGTMQTAVPPVQLGKGTLSGQTTPPATGDTLAITASGNTPMPYARFN